MVLGIVPFIIATTILMRVARTQAAKPIAQRPPRSAWGWLRLVCGGLASAAAGLVLALYATSALQFRNDLFIIGCAVLGPAIYLCAIFAPPDD